MRTGIRFFMTADQITSCLTQRWLVAADVYRRRSDRGSVTIEQVIWAVALIAIVAIVVTAITNYVTTKAGQIK
jgi:hypothetical protein